MDYLILLVITYMVLMLASSQIPPGSPVIDGPQVIVLNSQITLTCTSPRGDPPPSVKWFFDDSEITTGISTTTAGTAVITSLTFAATKNYHLEILECQAENGVIQNPLSTAKYIEVHFSPEPATLTGPTTLTPGQQGIWTCMSTNGYPAGVMSMRNQNKNTQFTTEFTSNSVLDQKSYDVTGTLTWSPVSVNNGDIICCDVTHKTTATTPQTVCRQITVSKPIAIKAINPVNPVGTPPITSIPQSSYTQISGQQIILGCTVNSPNSPLQEVQWTFSHYEGQTSDYIFVLNSDRKYSGSSVKSPSLTINSVASTDQGVYSCFARNLVGTSKNNPTTSLTVTGSVPIVQINPSTYTATYGSQVVINCNIVSASPAATQVYWQRSSNNQVLRIDNGDQGYQGSTTSSPSLTINFVTTANTGVYTCFATNVVGTGSSNLGIVTITGAEPTTNVKPRQYTATVGDTTFQIQCLVTATPGATSWYWTFQPVGGSQQTIAQGTNDNQFTVDNSGTNPHLTLKSIALNEAGIYTCYATNAAGTSDSSNNPSSRHTLTVIGGDLDITVSLTTYSAITGDSIVTILCKINGTAPAIAWDWTKTPIAGGNSEIISQGTNNARRQVINSATKPNLNIYSITEDDEGIYRCRANNGKQQYISEPIILKVQEASLRKVPGEPQTNNALEVEEGRTVMLTCSSTGGNPAPSVVWLKDSMLISTGSNSSRFGNVTTTTLTFVTTSYDNLEVYACQTDNGFLQRPLVKTTYLLFSPSNKPPGQPIITGSQRYDLGDTVTLSCSSTGGNPLPTMNWLRDDNIITTGISRLSGSGMTSITLTFVAGLEDHLEVFECQAHNNYLQNHLASTTYIELYFAPRVPTLTGPSSLISGSSGKWTCSSANGYPAPTLSMRIQDRQYTNEITVVQSYDIIGKSYSVAATLNFVPSTDKTGQDLCCDVSYLFDNNEPQSTCLQLTINGLLFVSVTPRNSTVAQENSQIISCIVTGTPPSTCITWLFTPAGSTQQSILSTTNSNKYTVGTQQEPYLTVLNFEPGDSGTYICRAINAVGSSSSYPGSTLQYISAPITSVEPNQHAAKVEDASFQIQCNVTATPGAFDWYWTFQPIVGSVDTIYKGTNSQEYMIENSGTNPHLTIKNIATNKTGVYTCYALNTAGMSVSASNANSQHTLTVTEDSSILCGENIDKFDIKWGITAEKNLVTLACNGNYTGSVSRYCSNGGKWMEPDYSQCMRKSIQNIQSQSAKLLSGESEDTVVSTILQNLENTTSKNTELRSGDLVASSAVLDDIVRYVTNHTDKLSVNQLEIFGSVCNNILDERNHQLWEELNNERSNGVPSVVKAVTDYNEVYHKVIDGEFAMIVQKENIVIEVGKTISDEITVPDRSKTSLSWIKDSATEIKLKKSIHNDLTGYSCTFYRNISRFFPNYFMLNGELQSFNGSYDVNSIITDFTIESTTSSDNTLIIKLENLLENYHRPFCGFWDFDVPNTVNGAWSNFGSRLVESTDSYTICEYNHTTNFAILMSPGSTPLSHNFALSLISAIGCGVSILFLVITIIIHYVLWRYVKNDRTKILLNLCVALILSYTIFLAGITRTEIKEVCTAIAVGLHYMFLTDFCLMLAEGIQIMRMVVIVFSTKPIVHWLLPLCWVLPGIIVGISVGVTELEGYGNQQFCWLSLESSLIWAFIGPALLIILINCVIFVIMVYKMMTIRGIAGKTLREKARIGLKSICIILPLFGVTWVLGAFSVNDDLVVFQYLFAIFNSLQGLFICVFQCFLNKQIRQGYDHYQRRLHSKSTNSTTTDNTKRSSSHRQRFMYRKEESLKRTISTS